MGYRLKLPSGQEITARWLGQEQARHSSRPWTKCKGFGSVVKKSLVTESQSLNRLPQTFSKTLLPMNCGFMLQEAHKLAGSLGMFGFRGSQLAREIEQIFQAKTPLDQNQALHLSELVVALRCNKLPQLRSWSLEQLMSARNCWWLTTIDHWLRSWSWRLMPWGCGWILPRICPRPGMQSAAIAPMSWCLTLLAWASDG